MSFHLHYHETVSNLSLATSLLCHRNPDMQGTSRCSETLARIRAHRLRCQSLPPMQAEETARLVADFLATREITSCPTRYAAPVEQRLQPVRSGY